MIFSNERTDIINAVKRDDLDRQYHAYKINKIFGNWANITCVEKHHPEMNDSPGLIYHKSRSGEWIDTGATDWVCCDADLVNHKWLVKNGFWIPIKKLF